MQALILVATKGGPTMLARIGIMRALNRNQVREFNSDRKPNHWAKWSAAPYQAQCIPTNMALQMQNALSGNVAEFGRFNRM